MDTLEGRSREVLKTIISQYVRTGEPVGSRTVAKKTDLGLSSASIRNIMSDLTEAGYITQPHVSAGRIPTDKGYRVYVDRLTSERGFAHEQEPAFIEELLRPAGLDTRDILRLSSSVLAGLSHQTGVVTAPAPGEQTFKTIEFIKVSEDRILVVLVSTGGLVQNKMIVDEHGLNQETLERFSRMLNDMLKDLDLSQARERIERELAGEKAKVNAMLSKALQLGHIILSLEAHREVFIEGQTNILNEPEFAQIERLRALLSTFDEKSRLLKILDKTLEADDIQILIGSEHGLGDIESCSIIAYPVRTGDTVLASISVIGPKRMNYRKVVPLVVSTGRVLTRLVKNAIENPI